MSRGFLIFFQKVVRKMNLFDLFCKITLDTSDYDKGIEGAKGKSGGLLSSFKNVGNESVTLQNKIKVLGAQYDSAQKDVERLTNAFNKSVSETGAESKETQKLSEQLKEAESKANGLKSEIDDLSNSQEKASEKTSSFAENLKKEIESVAKGTKAVAKTIADGFNTISKIGEKAGTTIVKTYGLVSTALSATAGVLTKLAIDNYADYEQLVGGVDTLFKSSSEKVKEYANNAYKTSGLSANEYMETVTSFSASLLQSLSGNTEAAADKADLAITDMADNANKMGTSMEMIQNSYQGFAKQNYTINLMSAA